MIASINKEATDKSNDKSSIFDPVRWGLPVEAINELGNTLYFFWYRFKDCFRTKTRDTSEYGHAYLSGQLRMETKRNYANIGRNTGVSDQNMQHFMSNSPWKSSDVVNQVQKEIIETKGLDKGGFLLLDESGDEKAGDKTAGAGRQYLGRLGKVEMSQMGVFIAYANLDSEAPIWTWVDFELYMQKHWFEDDMKSERKRLEIPEDRKFETKAELGLKMIRRAVANGLPFEGVACDGFYGQNTEFRAELRKDGVLYMADVPRDTRVYLNKPELGVPDKKSNMGRNPFKIKVISNENPVQVSDVMGESDWKCVQVRDTERGVLKDEFAVRRVWTIYNDEPVEEWLVVRNENGKKCSYSLSNASAEMEFKDLVWWKCHRYFVERANQDEKSEVGWDEFEAQKYRGFEHHCALSILACWFLAQTKLDWSRKYERDPELAEQFSIDILPCLSYSNIRELLRVVMPLPQLTPEEAAFQVVKHLVNRTRSRKSRIHKQEQEDIRPFLFI